MSGIKAFFCLAILLLSIAVNRNNASFSRTSSAVFFNRVFPINKSVRTYNPDQLIPMVSLVSTKFTNVATGAMDIYANRNAVLIPFAVATYNKFHRKVGEAPLELSFTFVVTNVLNESSTGPPNGWDSLVEILDEANHVHPGTVKRIYVQNHGILYNATDTDTTYFEKYFANARFPKTDTYELGISLTMDFCDSDGLPQVLKQVRHLSFFENANENGNQKPELEIQKLLSKFSECKRIIEGYGMDINIRIVTGWSCPNQSDGPEQQNNLVQYWSEVNDWAETSNTSVLFWEAFDTPDATEDDTELEHMGLWRLVPKSSYKNISEYVFEEKVSMNTISSFPWGLLFCIVFIVISVITILTLMFIRYYYPTVFYTKVVPYIPNFERFRVWISRVNIFCA